MNVPSSPYIEFNTLTPGTKGVVLSGIAIPEWHLKDDDTIHRMPYTINLGYPALEVTSATVAVGLASIYNGGSAFLFATDNFTLSIDPSTQELVLEVGLALQGDPASLSRIAYQVVATVVTQQTGISGTISFPQDLFGSAPLTVAGLKPFFAITASMYVQDSAGGFGSGHFVPVAYGALTTVTTQGGTVTANYDIPSPPYNVALTVAVAMSAPPPDAGFSQTAGPGQITVTVAAPDVSGVDFTYFVSPIK